MSFFLFLKGLLVLSLVFDALGDFAVNLRLQISIFGLLKVEFVLLFVSFYVHVGHAFVHQVELLVKCFEEGGPVFFGPGEIMQFSFGD